MNVTRERLARASRRLALGLAGAGLLRAGAAAGLVLAAAQALRRLSPGAGLPDALVAGAAVAAALGASAGALRRALRARSLTRVALWVEEAEPGLKYALVAAADPAIDPASLTAPLLTAAAAAPVEALVSRAVARHLGRAALPCALALGLWVALAATGGPDTGIARRPGDEGPAAPSRLTPLRAEVHAPAYARLPDQALEEPSRIAVLTGSRVVLQGRGAAAGVLAVVGRDTLAATGHDEGWAVSLTLDSVPRVLTLHDRAHRRLLSLEPQADSIPVVVLTLPARDTIFPVPPAVPVRFAARATDDLGLRMAAWEVLRTTGSGEQFQSTTIMAGRVALAGAREAALGLVLRLDTLRLGPGSVLSVRAVAFDGRDTGTRGRGVSETRTLRIATAEDSTAPVVEPPIPIDSMWVSQRLLNLRTDTLWLARRRLADSTYRGRAMGFSNAQAQIRERVLAVVALLEDDGVGGRAPTEESERLRTAAQEMLDARLGLAMAEVDSARPHMRRALAILDEIRLARRYHLRGVVRPPPVDIARVRLRGTEHGTPAPVRGPGGLPGEDRQLAARLARIARLAVSDGPAARDSLYFLRSATLASHPRVAALLAEALDAALRGEPVGAALLPARRALRPPARSLPQAPAWGGGGP